MTAEGANDMEELLSGLATRQGLTEWEASDLWAQLDAEDDRLERRNKIIYIAGSSLFLAGAVGSLPTSILARALWPGAVLFMLGVIIKLFCDLACRHGESTKKERRAQMREVRSLTTEEASHLAAILESNADLREVMKRRRSRGHAVTGGEYDLIVAVADKQKKQAEAAAARTRLDAVLAS